LQGLSASGRKELAAADRLQGLNGLTLRREHVRADLAGAVALTRGRAAGAAIFRPASGDR
jgi:hypothetical protein